MGDSPETAAYFIYVTQVYFCAMYAVVLWDWLISLSREYRFIWKTHWTPVKVAYLFCRYWVIAVVPYLLYCFVKSHSLETCERIFKIPVALAMWNQVGSESVLLIRTYAFFNRNIYILWFLISALSGVVAYQLYVDTTQMLLLPFIPPMTEGPCFPMSVPHSAHLLGFFIAPLLFDTVVTFMTVVKAITIRRRNGGPSSALIQTFIREGVFYYILISIANLVNGIFYLQPRQTISAINIPLSVMMGPVLACRLILDLRERGSETVSHSEGVIAPFTAKSVTHQCSPFTPPNHRSKSPGYYGGYGSRHPGGTDSNIVLSTLGSIPPDASLDHDITEMNKMDAIRLGLGMELGGLSAAVGGRDGEPLADDRSGDEESQTTHSTSCRLPIPSHGFRALEMGFKPKRAPSLENTKCVNGIRVDVQKTTATM